MHRPVIFNKQQQLQQTKFSQTAFRTSSTTTKKVRLTPKDQLKPEVQLLYDGEAFEDMPGDIFEELILEYVQQLQ